MDDTQSLNLPSRLWLLPSTLLLCLAALVNGFPLLFPDSMDYLRHGSAVAQALVGHPSGFLWSAVGMVFSRPLAPSRQLPVDLADCDFSGRDCRLDAPAQPARNRSSLVGPWLSGAGDPAGGSLPGKLVRRIHHARHPDAHAHSELLLAWSRMVTAPGGRALGSRPFFTTFILPCIHC